MTQTLIDIERSFRRLMIALRHGASARLHLAQLNAFMDKAEVIGCAVEPYLLEAVPLLQGIRSEELAGLDPEIPRRVRERLEGMLRDSSTATKEQVERLVRTLQEGEARLLEYVTMSGDGRPDALSEDPAADGVLVPIVERSVVSSGEDGLVGGLRRLNVRLVPSDGPTDALTFNLPVFGERSQTEALKADVLAAARSVAGRMNAQRRPIHFAFHALFDQDYAMHQGRSLAAGLATLLLCRWVALRETRDIYWIRAGAAISGDMDEAGRVLPVDARSLPDKVRAAFFSPVRNLVVPLSQREDALDVVQKLNRSWPKRRLSIVGAGHLEDMFSDRRIVGRRRLNLAVHTARRVWSRKGYVASAMVAIVLTLSAIGLRLWYGPLDRDPVTAEWRGEELIVKNLSGRIINTQNVGFPAGEMYRAYQSEGVAFLDINGDDNQEVVYGKLLENEHWIIACWDVERDEQLWRTDLIRPISYPQSLESPEGLFRPRHLFAGDYDNDGVSEIYVHGEHTHFYPHVIFKIEAKTGLIHDTYLHTGAITRIDPSDIDEDGITELYFAGFHQSSGDPMVGILDPRFIAGSGPASGEHAPAGEEPGLEQKYVRLPRSVIGQKTKYLNPYRGAYSLQVEYGTINVGYTDVQLDAEDIVRSIITRKSVTDPAIISKEQERLHQAIRSTVLPGAVTLITEFDENLHVKKIGRSSQYDAFVQFLIDEGFLQEELDENYWRSFAKEFLYWDGSEWVKGRVVYNKKYVAASGRLNVDGVRH